MPNEDNKVFLVGVCIMVGIVFIIFIAIANNSYKDSEKNCTQQGGTYKSLKGGSICIKDGLIIK